MPDDASGESPSDADAGEPETYIESLRLQREEYRAVLDHQIQWASRIDTKAIRTSQIILVLLGILVSVSQVAQQPLLSANLLLVGGVIALFVAFVLGVFTYSATGLHSGTGAGYGTDIVTETPSETLWLESLVQDYEAWVLENEQVIRRDARLLLITQIAIVIGVFLLLVGLGRTLF